MHFERHCTWWVFMDIIVEFKKRKKGVEYEGKKFPFLDLNGMVSFGPWLMKMGRIGLEKGKMNTIIYYGRILPSIFYCLKLSHLSVAFSCCINAVVDCANFLVKLAQYFFLRKRFVYNFGAFIVCIRKCIRTFGRYLLLTTMYWWSWKPTYLGNVILPINRSNRNT